MYPEDYTGDPTQPPVTPPGAPGTPPPVQQPTFGQRVRPFFGVQSSLAPPPGANAAPGAPGATPGAAPGTTTPTPPAPGAAAPGADPMQGSRDMARAMLSMNQFAPQEQSIQRQQALADRLRAGAPGMMKSQSPINTPNWAGALAGAAAGIKSNLMDDQAREDALNLAGQKATRYGQLFGPGGFQ